MENTRQDGTLTAILATNPFLARVVVTGEEKNVRPEILFFQRTQDQGCNFLGVFA